MRSILVLLATTLLTPALADPPAEQPDATVPPVVVTATRVPTPAIDIPAGVTVITRQDIETYRYNTLVDALRSVPGLRVAQSGGPGGQASVFIRGTNSDAVLVLRDGMPINDASDSDGAFNFGIDTLADVQRIEIIRGPMAALYGSGAIGGVINLITRRGTEEGAHWEGDLSGGYPAQIRGSAVASGIEGPVDYALVLELQSQRGYDTTPQREFDLYRRAAGLSRPACHAEPRLHGGAGHAGVAAAACARVAVRFQRTRGSHLRRFERQRHRRQPARAHRRHVEFVRRHLPDQPVPGARAGGSAVL